MPVLRSREIPSPPPPTLISSKPKTLRKGFIEPSTPSKSTESSLTQSPPETTPSPNPSGLGPDSGPILAPPRRRSLRLASMSGSAEIVPYFSNSRRKRRRNVDGDEVSDGGMSELQLKVSGGDGVENVNGFDGLGLALGLAGVSDSRVSESKGGLEIEKGSGFLSLRSGVRTVKGSFEFVVEMEDGTEVKDVVMEDRTEVKGGVVMEDGTEVKDAKGKTVLVERGGGYEEGISGMNLDDDGDVSMFDLRGRKLKNGRRFTREEKGKDKLVGNDVLLNTEDSDMLRLNLGFNYSDAGLTNPVDDYENGGCGDQGSVDNGYSDSTCTHLLEKLAAQGGIPVHQSSTKENVGQNKSMMNRYKEIARQNASRFAYFDAREEEGNRIDYEEGADEPLEQPVENVEDWPGPFSTAMKIIRDRENNVGGQAQNSGSGKAGMPLVSWTPRKERDHLWSKRAAPSLQDMCLHVLARNVDAIASLTYVPDVLRHKLAQMLCYSRRMNGHFLDLLLEGSPSEIRLPDCSWLEEDKFEKSFEACDPNNLTVLQLDLCGHCLSDSSLLKALVPKGLPSLTMVSLKGACRISDVGLRALVSSAPALRSMNLSQCSLLTDVGIDNLANSLGSILRELYLDDCESLDAMRILPGLKKLQSLEVLSLRGIGSVSDKFIKQLIISNGQNMKELILANCVKLTDSSLKVIAETCSQLCVLDLSHVTKLTDIGMVYLANGCREIQDLKLCRNAFSDDAIAAFLEASGESLKELSLNNITKVGQNTTISLSRCCKNLQCLDLSWCRNLTDEALGLIADSCLSLRVLKIFGCTQITRTFLDGHSNPHLQVIGMKLTPILGQIKRPDFQQGPLHYSAVPSF